MGGLNQIKRIQLDLLEKFIEVCKRENLTWFAIFGTLLGAVRHGGFIPWDDDIDVAMPRADYERLRNHQELFSPPYFLQTPQNDPAAFSHFMTLRHSKTTMITAFPHGFTRGGNMGIAIDILPLDDVPGARQARQLHAACVRIQKQMYACAAIDENAGGELPDWKAEVCYGLGGLAGQYARVAEQYEWLCSRYSNNDYLKNYGACKYYAMPVVQGFRGCRVFEKEWFAKREIMKFEDLDVHVPAGYRELLIACYPDGLLVPELDERNSVKELRSITNDLCLPKHSRMPTKQAWGVSINNKESIIIDTEQSYQNYTSRYLDMLKDIEDKQVLIFGAGDSLRIWLERYAKDLDMICTFDNDAQKWGSSAYGLTVSNPKELPALVSANTRIIIASLYHQEIGRQLNEMGINDYYVFVDGLNYERKA
jgi:lipopolysaccharide cholinephosphotransferase